MFLLCMVSTACLMASLSDLKFSSLMQLRGMSGASKKFEMTSSVMDAVDNILCSMSIPKGVYPVCLSFEHGFN